MWPVTTFTLGFRGLMVIHRVETVQPKYFEIGVVDDPDHFLRINSIKNGKLAETKSLEEYVNTRHKIWTLEVDNPMGAGVGAYTAGPAELNRKTHPHERDYRWLVELDDLLPGIENELKTNDFKPVLRVYNGIFFTRVKSPELSKIVSGASHEFGHLASVVAVDIPMLAGRVRLMTQGSVEPVVTFEPDENTIYEFANTPCDVPDHGGGGHHDPRDPDDDDEEDPCMNDHFHKYYSLFEHPENRPSICFRKRSAQPAPDPATCGAVGAGGIKDPFGGA